LPPPVNQLNAEEVREGMQSLRRVANISARSAVASYHWKRTRGHLVFSTILSAGALVAFCYLAMTEGTSELTFAALAVGVVMLGETYRLISKVRKLRDVEGGAVKKQKKSKRNDSTHLEVPHLEGSGAVAETPEKNGH
jgi:CHASE2 domain-containing sensor protein